MTSQHNVNQEDWITTVIIIHTAVRKDVTNFLTTTLMFANLDPNLTWNTEATQYERLYIIDHQRQLLHNYYSVKRKIPL